ncbi:MAG: neocarzinostatin apoprotein domain-containing protein [Acidimicrobiia bacterium]
MRRILASAAIIGFTALVMAPPAGAAGTVTVTPSSNLTDGTSVTVSWTGLTPNGTPSIVQCKDAPTTGASGADCEFLTLQVASDASDASGHGTDTFVVHDTTGLQALNSRTGVLCDSSHAGAILVLDNPNDVTTGAYKQITCTGSGTQVPETSFVWALPLGAAAVIGGAFFLHRRNRRPVTLA